MEGLGQLTTGVAHDFGNLLTAIGGCLEMLEGKVDLSDRNRSLFDTAIRGVERGTALTQRLLDYARPKVAEHGAVSATKLVQDMSGLVTLVTGPRIAVRQHYADGEASVAADPNELEVALLNLCANARDAMPGGGTLMIGVDEVAADSDAGPPPAEKVVRISVTDSGTGMDAATLARATEPYFTTKEAGHGTGLGLSMVASFAARAGGRLAIESRPGQGTAAHLYLPRAVMTAGTTGPDTREPNRTDREPTLRILLVDDDNLVRSGIASMLEQLGHHVTEADSGDSAIALLDHARRFDLVVTDYGMPGMTGVELITIARRKRAELAFVLTTGYTDLPETVPQDVIRLAKPFRYVQLGAALAELGRLRDPALP